MPGVKATTTTFRSHIHMLLASRINLVVLQNPCNLPIEDRESSGCPFSQTIMRNCVDTQSYPASERMRHMSRMFTYVDPRTFKIQIVIRITSNRSTSRAASRPNLEPTFLGFLADHSTSRKISWLEPCANFDGQSRYYIFYKIFLLIKWNI